MLPESGQCIGIGDMARSLGGEQPDREIGIDGRVKRTTIDLIFEQVARVRRRCIARDSSRGGGAGSGGGGITRAASFPS